MASLRDIFNGFYTGVWNFCFPEVREQKRRRQLEYVVRKERLDWSALHRQDRGILPIHVDSVPIIVSLTSYGKRIHTVHRVIESIFLQTFKANRVILYLSNEEYQNSEELPLVLQLQMSRGLEVRFVRDLRSYKKLIPALSEFPDATIITVDDDVFYPMNMIERLLNAHRAHPDAICSLVNRKLLLDPDGTVGNYNDFPFETVGPEDIVSPLIIPEGFGGVLYPPHSLPEEVFHEEMFMQLAPSADDLWFKAMSLIAHTSIVKVHSYFDFVDEFIVDEDVQDVGLKNLNLDQNANNRQFKALFEHYNLCQYL